MEKEFDMFSNSKIQPSRNASFIFKKKCIPEITWFLKIRFSNNIGLYEFPITHNYTGIHITFYFL